MKDGDIVGDAVNVASRIEPLAATGGICVSGGVYEAVRNKPGISGVYLGAKSLKNVSEPLRVYGLTEEGLPAEAEIRKAAEKVPSLAAPSLSPKVKLAVAALILVVVAGMMELSTPGGMDEESPQAIFLGFGLLGVVGLNFLGLGLGVAGLLQANRLRTFAVLGLVFNGLVIFCLGGLMVVGLTMTM